MVPPARPLAALLLLTAAAAPALATKYDTRPRPARILAGGERFVAQDRMESLTLYSADGRRIHTFPSDGHVGAFDVSADERTILIAGDGGGVGLWSLETGQAVWRVGASRTGLDGVYDASLSQDGTRCVVCNTSDFAVVLDARTGAPVGRVGFARGSTSVMSAALAPDGRTGVLVDLGEQVLTFDVQTGGLRHTGHTGAWPIRFAADGRHVACRDSNSGSAERLRVIVVETWQATDVGRFSHIGHIRPVPDGGFHVTARVDDRTAGTSALIGAYCSPGAAEPTEVWRRSAGAGSDIGTDFVRTPVRGVSTDYRLITHLTDLETGNPVQVIDNSANYEPTLVSWSSSGPDWRWLAGGVGMVALAGLAVFAFWLRRGR